MNIFTSIMLLWWAFVSNIHILRSLPLKQLLVLMLQSIQWLLLVLLEHLYYNILLFLLTLCCVENISVFVLLLCANLCYANIFWC